MSSYIYTYLGLKFYPLDPRTEDIDIRDIAHALSLVSRANGHLKYFFSVAQHSINCYKEAKARNYSKKVQLACLLHDGSEAYLSDITRPVKGNLPEYKIIEKKLQDKIYDKFLGEELTEDEKKFIDSVDDCMLHVEFKELMGINLGDENNKNISQLDLRKRDFEEVERELIEIFDSLKNI